MIKISRIITVVFLIISTTQSYSQSLSSTQHLIINKALLELLNDYESYSRFTSNNKGIDENYISQFNNLFNKNASLYIDILPSNKVSDTAGLSEYIEIFRKFYSNGIGVKLHNILFETPSKTTNGSYRINVELSKEIYGYTKTNVNYSDAIPLIFTISFNISGNNVTDMKILDISGYPRGRFLKFRVFKFFTMKPVEDAEIRIDSKFSKTNSQGIANIENIDPAKTYTLSITKEPYRKIVYSHLDIDKFIEGNNSKNHQRMKYDYYDPNEFIYFIKTINFTLTPFISFNIPGMRTIMSKDQNEDLTIFDLKDKAGFSPRFGARLGVTLFRTSTMDFSLNAGIEKNFIRASFSFDSCLTETSKTDVHGQYTRFINFYDQQQKITLNFTEFPILLSVNFKSFKNYDIGADFGIRLSNLRKSSCSIKSGIATTDPFQQSDTVLTRDYHNIISESKFFAYQFGINISRRIGPSLRIYASPTLFLYNKDLMKNKVAEDILRPDGEINNILYTYKRNTLHYIALEFGLRYNFNSINLRKKQ